jgi:transcriptional regulator with GAF, ATPase, and Fis domain
VNIEALRPIMLSIAAARSLEPILQQIVRGVAEASDMALVRLWLVQPDSDCPVCAGSSAPNGVSSLHLRASTGNSRSGRDDYTRIAGAFHRIPIGKRKIGQIAASGKEMLIPNITGHEEWIADVDWLRREGIKSFAGQPLAFKGETVGVLAVFSRAALSADEFNWLRTFADHAAVAIANARAFDELDRLRKHLEAENEYLHDEIRESLHFGEIVGQSPALKKVLEQVALVAETNATVLIQGESGTGKELIARAIHERSPRRARPFIKVNCGAIPEDLFESEFFGHVKGAFTGAVRDRVGRFELADTGDIFLDEIAEIPTSLQTKLLRVLQEKQFERVGEGRTRTVDVRVIGATNRDLKSEVERGRFREDLFYRLSVFPIELPPLRERKADIPILAASFLRKSAAKLGLPSPRLTQAQARQLQEYDWPGNIRELENVIERATILSRHSGRLIFEFETRSRRKSTPHLEPRRSDEIRENRIVTRTELREREIESILQALQQSNGKVFGPGGAAELLGMRPTTLASRMKSLGIRKSFYPKGKA